MISSIASAQLSGGSSVSLMDATSGNPVNTTNATGNLGLDVYCIGGCGGGGGGGTVDQGNAGTDPWLVHFDNTTIGVTGTFWQATQPISVLSLPLPTGAAQDSSLSTINSTLGSPMQNSGGSVTANIGTTNGLALDSSLSTINSTLNTDLGAINTTLGSPFQAGGSIANTSFINTTSDVTQTTTLTADGNVDFTCSNLNSMRVQVSTSNPSFNCDSFAKAISAPLTPILYFDEEQLFSNGGIQSAGFFDFNCAGYQSVELQCTGITGNPSIQFDFRANNTASPNVNVMGGFVQLFGTIPLPTNAAQETGGNLDSIKANTTGLNLESTQSSFKSANHTDLAAINTTLGTPMQASGGSVTANAGTNLNTSLLSLESTQSSFKTATHTDLTTSQPRKLQDGSGNAITSQANSLQRALDVGIDVSGVQVDPRSIRALTSADTVTAVQGTGSNLHAQLDSGSTTTVTQGTGSNLHAQLDSGSTTACTQGTGTNLHTVTDSGSVTAATLNPETTKVIGTVNISAAQSIAVTNAGTFAVTQGTGTNLHAVLDSTSTTAVTQGTGSNLHAQLDSGSTTAVTQGTGTNLHAVIDSGSTTVVTGNVAVTQAAGSIAGNNPCINPTSTLLSATAATSGTAAVLIVAASGSTKVYICSLTVIGVSGTTPTFSLVQGTGATCAGSQTVLVQSWTTTAGAIFSFANPVAVTAASNAVCYLDTGTTPIQRYTLTYVQQ